ncbi:hypothetical protein [Methanocaldococcus sp.]
MNTLALRQFLFSISRNKQILKYGAAAGAGVIGYEGVKKVYHDITSPFSVKAGGTEINLFPIILIILVLIILKKKNVI